jgi:hypothetical protein
MTDQLFFIVAGKNAFPYYLSGNARTGQGVAHCRLAREYKRVVNAALRSSTGGSALILTDAVLLFLT